MQTWTSRESDSIKVTFQNDAKLKQTKEQVPQRGFKEAHVAVFNKGQNERKKKRTSTKQEQTEDSFRTIKNPTMKNNPGSFLEVALS